MPSLLRLHCPSSRSHFVPSVTTAAPSAAVSVARNVAKQIGVPVSPMAQKTDTQSRNHGYLTELGGFVGSDRGRLRHEGVERPLAGCIV